MPNSFRATDATTPSLDNESPLPDRLSDESLLRRLRLSDTEALEVLLRRYWVFVVDYLARFTGARDTAEDIAQQTFCQLWNRRRDWRSAGSVRALLYRIARNFAISEQRRHGARARSDAAFAEGITAGPTPLDDFETKQLRSALDRAIGALPLRQREVFVLRCTHDLSYKEVATVLDIAPQTVANQLSRALATLRLALRPVLES